MVMETVMLMFDGTCSLEEDGINIDEQY